MAQPEGYEEGGKEDWVWELQKGLYGMKQGGRVWNKTMNDAMIGWGFTHLPCEYCIYYRRTDTGVIITGVHVDDFISLGTNTAENERFKTDLRSKWKIADLGAVKYCIGIAIERDRKARTIALSQTALIDRIIIQFGMTDCYPVNIPMDPGIRLSRETVSHLSQDQKRELALLPYRSLVGCLMYLAIATRPDIALAVQQLSQYLDCYSFEHWEAGKRVIRYLKGTRTHKLHLGGSTPVVLNGFTDSNWAACPDTRRSISGYCFSLGSGVVSWAARKQKTVANSTCEAEYIATCESSKEAMWLRALLLGIDCPQVAATELFGDNQGSIALTGDPSVHSRTKHIDIKHHYIRECVENNSIRMAYIKTTDNTADGFTKPLPSKPFAVFRDRVGVRG
jgi:hypothetical protein